MSDGVFPEGQVGFVPAEVSRRYRPEEGKRTGQRPNQVVALTTQAWTEIRFSELHEQAARLLMERDRRERAGGVGAGVGGGGKACATDASITPSSKPLFLHHQRHGVRHGRVRRRRAPVPLHLDTATGMEQDTCPHRVHRHTLGTQDPLDGEKKRMQVLPFKPEDPEGFETARVDRICVTTGRGLWQGWLLIAVRGFS